MAKEEEILDKEAEAVELLKTDGSRAAKIKNIKLEESRFAVEFDA